MIETQNLVPTGSSRIPNWASGSSYVIGDQVVSPAVQAVYIRRTNGGGVTDPSADSANWRRSSGVVVGSDQFRQEAGTSITDADGYWLRGGLFATAASYPEAAALEHCKVTGLAATNSSTIIHRQSADNGAGTIVVTASTGLSGSQVLVSTDNGATWTAVTTSLAVLPTGVVWNGSRFIIAGNDGTNFYTRWSTNGTTWNAGGTLALTTVTSGTVRLAYNGTITYGVGSGSTAANASAFTTSDGVTLTGRTAAVTTAQTDLKAANGVFVLCVGSSSFYTSTDGITFTTRTATGTVDLAGYVGGTWILKPDGSHTYYTTTNFTTFTARTTPTQNTSILPNKSLSFDSSRVYLGVTNSQGLPVVWWSTDLINWSLRWLSAGLGNNTSWFCQGGKYFLPKGDTASASILCTANFATADYVGSAIPASSFNGGSSANLPLVAYRKLSD
jgi:hypothetical protein